MAKAFPSLLFIPWALLAQLIHYGEYPIESGKFCCPLRVGRLRNEVDLLHEAWYWLQNYASVGPHISKFVIPMLSTESILKIGTRSSPLALWQAQHVQSLLASAGQSSELVLFETQGDRIQAVSLAKIGSKGVFTQELEQALLDGSIDMAVHSAKDMPSSLPDGLELCAFTEREPAMDVLVSHQAIANFGADSQLVIGTSSTRRKATLARYHPHCTAKEARGNLQTRLRKLEEGQFDALLLAYAGVHRMGWAHLIAAKLDTNIFTPAVGQGSLALEVAITLPTATRALIRRVLNDAATEVCLLAERAFLHAMQGGCSIPTFGYATLASGQLHMQAGIIALDGQREVRLQETIFLGADNGEESGANNAANNAETAIAFGAQLGAKVLAAGGQAILAGIRKEI